MSLHALTQAVMTSKTGTVNNVIQVKTTDFEVFDALRIDSEDSADMSGTSACIYSFHSSVTPAVFIAASLPCKNMTRSVLSRFVQFPSRPLPTGSLRDQIGGQDQTPSYLASTPAASAAQQGHGHLCKYRFSTGPQYILISDDKHQFNVVHPLSFFISVTRRFFQSPTT